MTNLNYGLRDIAGLVQLFQEGGLKDAEAAAKAALEYAFELYEKKAGFVIVGQLKYDNAQGFVAPSDVSSTKVAFGPYGTRRQAEIAGEQLAYSKATGEEFRWWVLEQHKGTPASWFKTRKAEREAAELADDSPAARVARKLADQGEEAA